MKSKYALFYDFHTSTVIPDVGHTFDVERFTDKMKECGVDYVTWAARCNQGNAYYNTQFGYRHPSLKFDMLGELAAACHRKGIRISAYFNGGLSDEELLRNPSWMMISPDGHCLTERRPSAEMRAACYNSPYREHLKNMVRELAEKYPVDGFFFDCMGAYYNCICPTCVAEMKEKGINFRDPKELREFTIFSIKRLAGELYDVIKSVNPDLFFFLNGSWVEEMLGKNTQLECECLPPCMDLGYDYLPVQAHYLRTVAGDNTVLCMTGRFYSWGDFGGLRKEESLEYDLLYGVANGMRPEVADHFHPRGDIYEEVFDLTKKVYSTIQAIDPWCLEAVNKPNVAVVSWTGTGILRSDKPLKMAVRMLSEMKIQFNVVTEASSWEDYDLLIFPDNGVFSPETASRVRKHLARGGKVIATGNSGLDPELKGFVLEDLWPVSYVGPTPHDPIYYAAGEKFSEGLPSFPLSVYALGTEVKLAEGAEAAMWTVKPYHNHAWDGIHSNWYTPPQEKTTSPFVAQKGNIIYCSGRIFEGYFNRSPYQNRLLLGNMLKEFLPRPKFRSDTLPTYARAFVQYNGEKQDLLHLLCYTPELRGEAVALEERGTLVNTHLAMRIDDKEFKKVYLAPSMEELEFKVEDGYCHVTLPLLIGHALIVFEK